MILSASSTTNDVVFADLMRLHVKDGATTRARFDSDPSYEREWRWQYLFPAKSLSLDPDDGRLKMHHVHENSLQKAVHQAVAVTGMTKRVTCPTFRHSFADVQKLLGHSRIETTMIYNHVISPVEKRIKSPLDL